MYFMRSYFKTTVSSTPFVYPLITTWQLPFPGLDVTANQEEATDTEIFQVELDKSTQEQCRIRTCQNTLWVLDPASSGIQNGSSTRYTLRSLSHLQQGGCLFLNRFHRDTNRDDL